MLDTPMSYENRIVSHTTDTDTHTKLTYILGKTKFTWHDGRYAHAQFDRGGADADTRMRSWTGEGLMHVHLEGVGLKARPLTLKLTTDSGYQMESFMSPTTLKMLSKGQAAKRVSASGAIWEYIHPRN